MMQGNLRRVVAGWLHYWFHLLRLTDYDHLPTDNYSSPESDYFAQYQCEPARTTIMSPLLAINIAQKVCPVCVISAYARGVCEKTECVGLVY